MKAYKQVYFHKFDMYQSKLIAKRGKADEEERTYFENIEIDRKFLEVYKDKTTNSCIVLDTSDSQIVLEFLDVNDQYFYARMGKQKDINSVHLRNRKTLEASPIQKQAAQDLEIFTYILIDREAYVVSYLKEQSAPSIQTLSSIITNNYRESHNLYGLISSVTIDDALPILRKKDIIGSISYRVSVPPAEKLSYDKLGLSEKQFETIKNQKSIDFDITLTAERNKNAIPKSERGNMSQFFKNILSVSKNVKVKAKDDDELTQEYNIVESAFTKRERFDFDSTQENVENEIQNKLKSVYERNKGDILEYVRQDG